MLSWAVTFLVVGLIAGLLGVSGVAGTATFIAYVLFVLFMIIEQIQEPAVAPKRGQREDETLAAADGEDSTSHKDIARIRHAWVKI